MGRPKRNLGVECVAVPVVIEGAGEEGIEIVEAGATPSRREITSPGKTGVTSRT